MLPVGVRRDGVLVRLKHGKGRLQRGSLPAVDGVGQNLRHKRAHRFDDVPSGGRTVVHEQNAREMRTECLHESDEASVRIVGGDYQCTRHQVTLRVQNKRPRIAVVQNPRNPLFQVGTRSPLFRNVGRRNFCRVREQHRAHVVFSWRAPPRREAPSARRRCAGRPVRLRRPSTSFRSSGTRARRRANACRP